MKKFTLFYLFLLIQSYGFSQQIPTSGALETMKLTKYMKQHIRRTIRDEKQGILGYPIENRIKYTKPAFILRLIDSCSNEVDLDEALHLASLTWEIMIPKLLEKLLDTNHTKMFLMGYTLVERPNASVGVDPRSTRKERREDYQLIHDDIFKVAGRCNYILKKITGENFGNVTINANQEALRTLQKKWIQWFIQRIGKGKK